MARSGRSISFAVISECRRKTILLGNVAVCVCVWAQLCVCVCVCEGVLRRNIRVASEILAHKKATHIKTYASSPGSGYLFSVSLLFFFVFFCAHCIYDVTVAVDVDASSAAKPCSCGLKVFLFRLLSCFKGA